MRCTGAFIQCFYAQRARLNGDASILALALVKTVLLGGLLLSLNSARLSVVPTRM